ncbi:hypothetical protein ANRL4_01019 [Anaerolineae bacterium]|nr:hypothetical protein ANRL4_01019 [Anaerolineae bacterium]
MKSKEMMEALTFLQDLFEGCSSGYLTLTAIHPDGQHPVPSRHVPIGDEFLLREALKRLGQANDAGWGAYFGVAVRQNALGRWSRGGRHNLLCLPALYVDLDRDPDEAWTRLAWFDLPPSVIIRSGRGYHAYWYLLTPTDDFDTADWVLHGLAKRLEGDPAVTTAHSMRLPGTVNTKPGREGLLCTVVRAYPERRYALSEFLPYGETPPKSTFVRPRLHIGSKPDRQLWVETVTEAVMTQLEGRWKANGFIAARCPYCHLRDRVGMHFSYNPESGIGRCFGKHGLIGLYELAEILGVSAQIESPRRTHTAAPR